MGSSDREAFSPVGIRPEDILNSRLRGVRMETVSAMDDRISLHHQYPKRRRFDPTAFAHGIRKIAGGAASAVCTGC